MRSGSRRPTIVSLILVTAGLARANTPITTTDLRISDGPPARIVWNAKDTGVVTPVQGSAHDPRCAPAGGGAGGVIRFFSDRSAGSTQDTGDIPLPCANWKAVGPDTNPRGFVYVDSDQSEGPCTRVTVNDRKDLKASCSAKRGPLAYDLTLGIHEGSVAASLRVGPSDRWCGSADATGGRDGSDGRRFQGRRAPAPATCPIPFVCGDGIPMGDEQCDDGDLAAGDGCDAACRVEDDWACVGQPSVCSLVCSDGTLDDGETCDDGNLAAGDGCDPACQVEDDWSCTGEPSVCGPSCSDGTLDVGETCDDGNVVAGDGCDAACQTEDDFTCVGEPSVCTTPCGDGLVIGHEECEDGGAAPGDGCSDTCTIEPGYACTGAPSVCTPGCGDGTVGGSEQCDDANTVAADGCSEHCAYEPLCLVTRDRGNPAHASLAKITRDGTVTPIGGATLPGNDSTFPEPALAPCGRRIYFDVIGGIAGFEVALDGTTTALPTFTTDSGAFQTIFCTPAQDLIIRLVGGFAFSLAYPYRVDAGTGALTAGPFVTFSGFYASFAGAFHPTTHDLHFAIRYRPPRSEINVNLGRITYDAAGNLAVAQDYNTDPTGFPAPAPDNNVDGLAFTSDASELVLFSFFDGAQTCFGQFDAPGTSFPPISALQKTCTGPVPVNDRWFVPRPEDGPLFYFGAGGTLYTGAFDPPTIDIVSSLPGITEGKLLLGFDGRVLVSLNAVAGTVETYDVASDLVTLTPIDSAPIGAAPLDGVLLPCPGL
jgi:cysteine-rich repeat protein